MHKIRKLARLSVMRATGFASLAVLMVMMGSAHNLAASFCFGAAGMLVISLTLAYLGETYHRRDRVTETEVWIMLEIDERPPEAAARTLIVNAMRAELLQKSRWAILVALGMLVLAGLFLLAHHIG